MSGSGRWAVDRWDDVPELERGRWLDYGSRAAPGESPPAYAERLLRMDRKLTPENAAKLSNIFRAAYEGLVDQPPVKPITERFS